jgi:SagB-type dehydrogenase family enzyme
MLRKIYLLLPLVTVFSFCMAQDSIIQLLPTITFSSGKTLMQALNDRHSTRVFSDKELNLQQLSNLLWAADGINRKDADKRTAPSAMNKQEIDIYVFLKTGIYLYDAHALQLKLITSGDHRAAAGMQDYVATAPVNLVYVADYSKMGGDDQSKQIYASADAAFIGENVYLYCSAFDLACVFRASIEKETVAKLMNLKETQKVVSAQTVGFPK